MAKIGEVQQHSTQPQSIKSIPTDQKQSLKLWIIACHNLPRSHVFCKNNTYVKITLIDPQDNPSRPVSNGVFKTKVIMNSLNPRWEELFHIQVKPNVHKLLLTILDRNIGSKVLGRVEVNLKEIYKEAENSPIFYILNKYKGHLEISYAYDEPILPEGWEERLDSSNRAYYINHNTKETQWKHPITGKVSTKPKGAESEPKNSETNNLPSGWSIQYTADGKVFYVNHVQKQTQWNHPITNKRSFLHKRTNKGDEGDLKPLPDDWEECQLKDGTLVYVNHFLRKTQWEDPRFLDAEIAGPPINYSEQYNFKYNTFRKLLPLATRKNFKVNVPRDSIVDKSFQLISQVYDPTVLRAKLWVNFFGESGLDFGGLTKEWFCLLSKGLCNPDYGLFEYSSEDSFELQINPNSSNFHDNHLMYFKFFGRIAGMAVYHGNMLSIFFTRPFYKTMLNKQIYLKDIQSSDKQYYDSLKFIKENDPSGLEATFSVDDNSQQYPKQVELIAGGANIPLTNENKDEYIKNLLQWRYVTRCKLQMDAFLEGFSEIIPIENIRDFNEDELEFLLCGIKEINVNDWKVNTEYLGGYSSNHRVILWFWKAVLSFTAQQRVKLLQFVTGSSCVPMNGFKELGRGSNERKFKIDKWGDENQLPVAHTCFHRIDVPPYSSYKQLKEKLLLAMELTEGFDIQ
ncbi:E3 ubiquitin-protein ligase NEDD4-like [Artemia franciscana]|uniref:E3 ubiquitin-protein ligase NEDD4-like n=1 Tax=Artemia franciscana TaxID=6661 RepID=UPI0032DB4396